MVNRFSIIILGDCDNWKLPLQVNLFSVPDGFATVTFSSQVFATLWKFESLSSLDPADIP